MFLRNKKGNMIAQFVVLLLVAAILIIIVTRFGVNILNAFIPGDDQSSMKSFNTLYSAIQVKLVSTRDYDSTTMGIYVKNDMAIYMFDKGDKVLCGGVAGNGYAYKPDACPADKGCLCIFKENSGLAPLDLGSKDVANKKVISCKSFDQDFSIDTSHDDLADSNCQKMPQYFSVIVAEKKDSSANKRYIYIMNNSAENRALDKSWNTASCGTGGPKNAPTNLCDNKKGGDVITFNDADGLKRIYDYCKSVNSAYKSTSLKCVYDETSKTCSIDCTYGDESKNCATYTNCENYDQIPGVTFYISKDATSNYKYYHLCEKDTDYCNFGNCAIYNWDVYTCKNSESGAKDDDKCKTPDASMNCNVQLASIGNRPEQFIESYDDAKADCKTYIEDKFYASSQKVLACKEGKNTECKQFVKDKKTTCQLAYLIEGNVYYWLTHYDDSNSECKNQVEQNFFEADECSTKATT